MIHEHQTHRATPPQTAARAERCASCNRAMTRDHATDIPHIGLVGPECRHKYAALLAGITEIEAMTFEDHQGGWRLANAARCCLELSGLDVLYNREAGVIRIVVGGRRKGHTGAGIVQSYRERRAEFERQLQIGQAERDAAEGALA